MICSCKNNSKYKVSTNKDKILKFILDNIDENKIILVTYKSLHILFDLMKENNLRSDLLIYDESHHILSSTQLNKFSNIKKSMYTLFFTATPINYNNVIMDYKLKTFKINK